MAENKHPIIAHGELYVEPIIKKGGGGPKKIPNEYQFAKQKILADIDVILDGIQQNNEVFLDEKIVCVRMEPKFEAKSYVPNSLMSSSGNMEIVGGRKYFFADKQGNEQSAKLYFIRTDDAGIHYLRDTLESGLKDSYEKWRNQIGSIHSLDLLSSDEKIMGFSDDWTDGTVEIVLHPLADEYDKMLSMFYETSLIAAERTIVRSYDDGLTFISAKCNYEEIERIKRFNPLRALPPLGRICISPIRSSTP